MAIAFRFTVVPAGSHYAHLSASTISIVRHQATFVFSALLRLRASFTVPSSPVWFSVRDKYLRLQEGYAKAAKPGWWWAFSECPVWVGPSLDPVTVGVPGESIRSMSEGCGLPHVHCQDVEVGSETIHVDTVSQKTIVPSGGVLFWGLKGKPDTCLSFCGVGCLVVRLQRKAKGKPQILWPSAFGHTSLVRCPSWTSFFLGRPSSGKEQAVISMSFLLANPLRKRLSSYLVGLPVKADNFC